MLQPFCCITDQYYQQHVPIVEIAKKKAARAHTRTYLPDFFPFSSLSGLFHPITEIWKSGNEAKNEDQRDDQLEVITDDEKEAEGRGDGRDGFHASTALLDELLISLAGLPCFSLILLYSSSNIGELLLGMVESGRDTEHVKIFLQILVNQNLDKQNQIYLTLEYMYQEASDNTSNGNGLGWYEVGVDWTMMDENSLSNGECHSSVHDEYSSLMERQIEVFIAISFLIL
ncbi:hypothetical protein MJG53_018894 [Ovis ammon polii x Ovis aries]|uniref:Uncharacterized protein n=1 Tax=Ovis ammon polii x Ovis aries TaxID=2918886 RepID=A0ACB9U3L3_9CETA|nr:hypothetical protein MJG53_018894 [Ovis ammon polii x Ovis aries]